MSFPLLETSTAVSRQLLAAQAREPDTTSSLLMIEYSSMPSPLLCLPTELLDLIASFIATHRDLIVLALTCRTLTRIVIPAHAAYRTIRLHGRRGSGPWTDIAARPHRAAGVRSVVLFDDSEEARFLPERAPNIIFPSPVSGPAGNRRKERGLEAKTLLAAARALRVMTNVQSLVFSGSLSRNSPACHDAEAAFWEAISSHGSLSRLEYTQPLSPPAPLPRYTTNVQLHPVRTQPTLDS